MAQIKDRYDQEIIDVLVGTYAGGDKVETSEPVVDPFGALDKPTLEGDDNTVLFSEVFHKPKLIPDVPLPMFKDEDWPEAARIMIPAVNPHWVWNKPALEQFALAMYEGDTTLIHGLMGTGKSCLAEQWCATFRIPFWRMSCNRETREQHFLGSPSVEYNAEGQMFIKQEPTLLTDSLTYGGMFCEDEAFRHSSGLVLQSLREKTHRSVTLPDAPGRTAEERKLTAPKGRWWYVLTDNTTGSGDETGIFDAEVQDASTLDRIDSAIEVPYLGKPDERKLLMSLCPELDKDRINGMLDFAKQVRLSFAKNTLMCTISVRGLMAWAQKTVLMGHQGEALKLSWYNKLGAQDKTVVEDIYHQVFARAISQADMETTNDATETDGTDASDKPF